MERQILFTLLHDAWGEGSNESLRLALMRVSAEALRAADLKNLCEITPEIPKKKWQDWCDYYSADRVVLRERLLADQDIHVMLYTDDDYPARLRDIDKPPSILYIKGHFQLQRLNIGMVGSRRATPYGKNVAFTLAKALSNESVCVISGLAKGIDVNAHKGAMEGAGGTIAVLGCGIDRIYPRENAKVYGEILSLSNGAIISEWPLGAPATAWHFPARNRIIAGLSDGVVVVEAAKKSGSLISANYALEYGKEVFAVPGLITSTESVGCHRLIKDGAKLVTQARDVLEEFGQMTLFKEASEIPAKKQQFSPDVQKVFDALNAVPQSVEDLCGITGLPVSIVNGILLELELEELVFQDYGRRYAKL